MDAAASSWTWPWPPQTGDDRRERPLPATTCPTPPRPRPPGGSGSSPISQIIADHSEIKWFHLISYDWTRASYSAQTGWKNNDFTASQPLLQKLVTELRKPRYLHAGDKALLKDYSRFAAVTPSRAAGLSAPGASATRTSRRRRSPSSPR